MSEMSNILFMLPLSGFISIKNNLINNPANDNICWRNGVTPWVGGVLALVLLPGHKRSS